MTGKILPWLRDESNRAIVKMAAAGLSAVCAGIWAVWMFMAEPSGGGKSAPENVTATSGSIAAGNDAVGNTITNDP